MFLYKCLVFYVRSFENLSMHKLIGLYMFIEHERSLNRTVEQGFFRLASFVYWLYTRVNQFVLM